MFLIIISFSLFSFLFSFIFSPSAQASLEDAYRSFEQGGGRSTDKTRVAAELMEEGYYYAAFPFIKKVLGQSERSGSRERLDETIGTLVSEIGLRPFELISKNHLGHSQTGIAKYLLAKQLFDGKKYDAAWQQLSRISESSFMKPFALFMEASILSLKGKSQNAIIKYEDCMDAAESAISDSDHSSRVKQLTIIRDYCLIGIPRTHFAMGNFEDANLKYLDLPKSSYVWPEILFEEAWTSFYQQNYNRALGKLVTYQAPILNFVFNPEIEILRAFTYLEMCLWADAKREVDEFYEKHHGEFRQVKTFLTGPGKPTSFYFKLASSDRKRDSLNNDILSKIMNSITAEIPYREMVESYRKGKREVLLLQDRRKTISEIRGSRGGEFFRQLLRNQLETLNDQREAIGHFVRKRVNYKVKLIDMAFEHMSYIKLEVIQRKRQALLAPKQEGERERGDIEYLERNEKQYFWDFNGEFWADELGDYVFALKSEC